MAENDNSSIYNPDKGTMFDAGVVEELHQRHELRVRDVQNQVSMQFDGLKRFARDLWKVQRFEDLIFGRVVVPIEIINTYLQEMKFPKSIKNVTLASVASGDIIVTITHAKYGRVILDLVVHQIIIDKDSMRIRLFLKEYEMPDTSWLIRNLIKLGIIFTGLEINALNAALPMISFKRGKLDNEYEVDLSGILKSTLDDYDLSMSMIRLIDWGVNDNVFGLQIAINAEKLINYLKKRMPILFD